MTERGKERATRAVLSAVCSSEGHHFPKVFVVGDHVYFTKRAAKRMLHWLEYDQIVQFRHGWLDKHVDYTIEEMTFEEAYENMYGRKMPNDMESMIDREVCQLGEKGPCEEDL